MQFFAGHIQISLYTLLGLTLYFIVRLTFILRDSQGWRSLLKASLGYAIVLAVGFSISSVQLIPLYELSHFSFRADGLPYDIAASSPTRFKHLITLFIPNLYGSTVKSGGAWGWGTNYWEASMYVGILPLLFALIVLIMKRHRYAYLFGGLTVIFLLLSMGANTPLYRLLCYLVPFLRSVRIPTRFVYLFCFFASALGALGFEYLLHLDRDKKGIKILGIALLAFSILAIAAYDFALAMKKHLAPLILEYAETNDKTKYDVILKNTIGSALFICASGLLLALYCWKRISLSAFRTVAICLLIADLFLFGVGYNRTAHRKLYTEIPEEIQFLKQDKDKFRVVAHDAASTGDIFLLLNLETPGGWSPLCIRRYGELIGNVDPRGWNPELHDNTPRIMELLNVKYILTEGNPSDIDAKLELVRDGKVRIYENKNFLPRVFIAQRAKIVEGTPKGYSPGDGIAPILKMLRKKDFIFEETVILEEEPDITLDTTKSISANNSVKIEKYLNDEVIIRTDIESDGFLVMSDVYYPGWKAYVDGKEQRIYRANYILRAIPLRKGKHIVRFVYEPLSFKVGLWITSLTALLILIMVAYNKKVWRRIHRRRSE